VFALHAANNQHIPNLLLKFNIYHGGGPKSKLKISVDCRDEFELTDMISIFAEFVDMRPATRQYSLRYIGFVSQFIDSVAARR